MPMRSGIGIAAIVLLLMLTGVGIPAIADDAAVSQRGADYLAPFKKDLMAALRAGLAEGPGAAIDACRIEAPAIAARHSGDGVRVGRSSHRLRNPANTAPDWVSPTLSAWLESGTREPVVIELDGERLGYVEPIIAKPLCLACHGEALAPAIAERIETLYPDDEATGFSAGDLRGVFWVEFAR
jgi:hypothetical protein